MTESSLAGYYAKRAAEYERICAKPERQADLAVFRAPGPRMRACRSRITAYRHRLKPRSGVRCARP